MQNFDWKDNEAIAAWFRERGEDLRDVHAAITCEWFKRVISRPSMTPSELERAAAGCQRLSRELRALKTLLPQEDHRVCADLQNVSRRLKDQSKKMKKRTKENSRRLGLKRSQENLKDFLVACCAAELKKLSIRHAGHEDLAWVEVQLRKHRLGRWRDKKDEAGGDGRTVRQLLARQKKRLQKTKQQPLITYIPDADDSGGDRRMSPEETLRHALAHFSYLGNRETEMAASGKRSGIFLSCRPETLT
jgi:hypothetical protein